MTVKAATGDKGVCDLLCSRLVRSRGRCERCGETAFEKLDAAHIVRRNWTATRTVLDNLWALCRSCHIATEDDPAAFMDLVEHTIGRVRYDELRTMAREGVGVKVNWSDERARLALLCRERSIETKRSAPGWHLSLPEVVAE